MRVATRRSTPPRRVVPTTPVPHRIQHDGRQSRRVKTVRPRPTACGRCVLTQRAAAAYPQAGGGQEKDGQNDRPDEPLDSAVPHEWLGKAGGSVIRGMVGRVGSSRDKAGSVQYYQDGSSPVSETGRYTRGTGDWDREPAWGCEVGRPGLQGHVGQLLRILTAAAVLTCLAWPRGSWVRSFPCRPPNFRTPGRQRRQGGQMIVAAP